MANRLLVLAILVRVGIAAQAAEPKVSYQRDIQPLLSDACYQCHGPDAQSRKASLRLDQRDAAIHPAESGKPAIVPGQPEQSELVRRILSNDAGEQMPPPDARRQLSNLERQRLQDWIAGGAAFDQHANTLSHDRPQVKFIGWFRSLGRPTFIRGLSR